MMSSISLQKVIDNPNDYNLTEEYVNDFLVKSKEYILRANLQNRSSTNTTNILLEDQITNPAVNCVEYCDSHMRQIFEDYRVYHGYVALVVSIFKHLTFELFTRNLINFGALHELLSTSRATSTLKMRNKLISRFWALRNLFIWNILNEQTFLEWYVLMKYKFDFN